MAAATRASAVPARRRRDAGEGAGQAGQGQREQRGPAPVDADGRDLLAGQVGDGVAQRLAAGDGQARGRCRVGQPFATQVASIAACLPEQFIATGLGCDGRPG